MTTSQHLPNLTRSPDSFLEKCGWHQAERTFLAGDASLRKYYRLTDPRKGSAVLMDAPPPEDPERFCVIARFLKDKGLHAPEILASDFEDGWVLLEDFGDMTYTQALKEGSEEELYATAVDTLIELHRRIMISPPFLKPYDTQALLNEARLLAQWYWPSVKKSPMPEAVLREFDAAWQEVFVKCTYAPKTLVLRDFHVDNLMDILRKQCGLLDFQDALWGSVTYDLVSLLEDARRDISPSLQDKMWKRYLQAFPDLDPDALKAEGVILSAGRHTKIIGIFTRLAVRDGKTHYLTHIPRVWRLLETCLAHPTLQPVKQWFDKYLSPPINQAMILAAGYGKRLQPLTLTTPKPLIPVAGRPLLDYTFEHLQQAGIQKCVLNTHHLADQLNEYITYKPNVIISNEPDLLETGGGITKALPHFGGKPFFSVNGDIWWQSKKNVFQQLQEHWREDDMDALLLLVPIECIQGNRTTSDYQLESDGRLIYNRAGGYIYAGIQLLHPRLFEGCEPSAFSIVPLYHKAESKGRLYGCVLDGQWSDIGTPEDLALLEKQLS